MKKEKYKGLLPGSISVLQMEMISELTDMWKAYKENKFFDESRKNDFHDESVDRDSDQAYEHFIRGTVEDCLSKLLLTIMGLADHFDVKLSPESFKQYNPSVNKFRDFGENCCQIINYIVSGLLERTAYYTVLNNLVMYILKMCRIYDLDIYIFICSGKYEFNHENSLVIKAALLEISNSIDENKAGRKK